MPPRKDWKKSVAVTTNSACWPHTNLTLTSAAEVTAGNFLTEIRILVLSLIDADVGMILVTSGFTAAM